MVPYTGNGAYCISNSLHMCLLGSARHASEIPGPEILECLMGLPFGYHFGERDGLFWPNAPGFGPDTGGLRPDGDTLVSDKGGVTLAMEALGWTCESWHAPLPDSESDRQDAANEAVERLRVGLEAGPVMLGPVDFGYLSHFRSSSNMAGFGHYIVGLSLDENGLLLHDPAGIPFAVLPLADLLLAWRADRVGYRTALYRIRSHFRRVETVTRPEMVERTLPLISTNTLSTPDGPVRFGGEHALRRLAIHLRTGVSAGLEINLLGFSMPTAARRAVDAARFLAEGGWAAAADLEEQKAVLWGRACSAAARRDWATTANAADQLVEVEAQLAAALPRMAPVA